MEGRCGKKIRKSNSSIRIKKNSKAIIPKESVRCVYYSYDDFKCVRKHADRTTPLMHTQENDCQLESEQNALPSHCLHGRQAAGWWFPVTPQGPRDQELRTRRVPVSVTPSVLQGDPEVTATGRPRPLWRKMRKGQWNKEVSAFMGKWHAGLICERLYLKQQQSGKFISTKNSHPMGGMLIFQAQLQAIKFI